MKVTVNIPVNLMEKAMKLSGVQNQNELIITALKAYISSMKRQQLITLKKYFRF